MTKRTVPNVMTIQTIINIKYIMNTGLIILIALLLFAFIILCHEFGHFIVAKLLGVRVLEFALGMGPAIYQYRKNEESTIYSFRLIPMGGFCRMQGEDPDFDDEDEEEDDEPIFKPRTMLGRPLLEPPEELDPSGSFGAQSFFNKIAILFAGPFMNLICCLGLLWIVYGSQGHGALISLRAAFAATGYIVVILWESLKQLFTGMVPLDQVSGIVGIAGAVTEQAQYGLVNVVYMMAVLSVNLGFVNLLPFPALDGGRILLTILNKLTGDRITPKIEGLINGIGMLILIILMVLLVFKDTIGLFR
jgi:regulator of sigma E protease